MNGELIFAYTRAQANGDGMLVKVPSDLVRQAIITVPVALTAAAWHDDVHVPLHLAGIQNETGRLWDVLMVLARAIRGNVDDADRVNFQVLVFDGHDRPVELYAAIGRGDDGEAVRTVMLPDED